MIAFAFSNLTNITTISENPHQFQFSLYFARFFCFKYLSFRSSQMKNLTITMESFNSGIFLTPLIVSSRAEMIGSNDVKSKFQDSLEAESRCSSFFLFFYRSIKQGIVTPLCRCFKCEFCKCDMLYL